MEKLLKQCMLCQDALKVPVLFIAADGKVLVDTFEHAHSHSFYSIRFQTLNHLIDYKQSDLKPCLFSTNNLEQYLFLKVTDNADHGIPGMLVFGPVLFSIPGESRMTLIRKQYYDQQDMETLRNYYTSLPVVSKLDLFHKGRLAYFLVHREFLELEEVIESNMVLNPEEEHTDQVEKDVSERRLNMSFHHDYLFEKEILQYIREGSKDLLVANLNSPPDGGDFGVLSKRSYLRDQKNLTISGITLATRQAIEGGIESEIAYSLSDLFIQHVEELKNVKEVKDFMIKALAEFAERVRRKKQKQYSKAVNDCLSYIFRHLYEELSLPLLACHVNISPAYLSFLFKKEVGMTVSRYVQKEKIEEAKKLIRLSDYSLSKICVMLNYADQSYFTKIFKNETGVTPRQYRNNLS